MTTKPWQPASKINIQGKEPGYRYKLCSKSDLQRKIAEGWEVVSKSTASGKEKNAVPSLPGQGSALDSTVQVGGLILCRMPEGLAKGREEYYNKVTDGLVNASVDKFKQEAREAGSSVYGELKIIENK